MASLDFDNNQRQSGYPYHPIPFTFNDVHRTFDSSSHSVPPINAVFDAVLLFGSPLDPTHTFDSSSISEPPIKSSVDPVQSFDSAIFA